MVREIFAGLIADCGDLKVSGCIEPILSAVSRLFAAASRIVWNLNKSFQNAVAA